VAGAAVDSKRQMSHTRTFGLREAMARAPSAIQIGVVGLAVLLAVAIFAVAVSAERFGDAQLLLFAVPLALASVGWGLRGGVALGVLSSLLAAAWWVERSHPGPRPLALPPSPVRHDGVAAATRADATQARVLGVSARTFCSKVFPPGRASSRLKLSESGGERRSWHHLQCERTP